MKFLERFTIFTAILSVFASFLSAQSPIDVRHYEAEISFDLSAKNLDGIATLSIRNASASSITSISLHLRDLSVSSVSVDGKSVPYSHANGELTINLDTPLTPEDSLTTTIRYSGTATSEAGPSSWGGCFWGETTFSMGVGFYAPYVSMTRHWLPSNDIPSDKATFDLTFIVPDEYVVAGAGTLADMYHKDGRSYYRWVESHQTATYLVMYAISKYAVVKDEWNGIPLEYYVRKTDSVKAHTYFSTVPQMMKAFTNAYGPYPFDKVGYCLTPIGAMEHQTMISYPVSMFSQQTAGIVAAHELAHQWWGDWVTPKDFREAWLSEGFATFSEAVYNEHLGGKDKYYQSARQFGSYYRSQVELFEGTFPLYDFPRSAPSSNYPQTIYQKGAAVLVMLRHILGDEAFFNGLRDYGNTFGYNAAGTRDFQHFMEKHFGKPLDWFFDQWIYKAGYPNYIIQRIQDDSDNPFRIRILQTQDSLRYPFFRMPLDVMIIQNSGDTVRVTLDNNAVVQEEFSFSSVPSNTVAAFSIDPLSVVLKKISYRTVGIEKSDVVKPREIRLDPVFPNPIHRNSTFTMSIPFYLATSQHVRLEIYDTLGRNVAVLVDANLDQGSHKKVFDGGNLASGMYTIHLRSSNSVSVRTFVISK